MTITLETFDAFVAKLNVHDWTYEFSDDHNVWKRGQAATADLQRDARISPWHKELYDAYSTTAMMLGGRNEKRQALVDEIRARLVEALAKE